MTDPVIATTQAITSQQVTVTGSKLKAGQIAQTERLFTARARYGKISSLTGKDDDLGGNRGNWSYIKLLTSDKQYKDYLSGAGTNRGLKYSELIGSGSVVAKMGDSKTGSGSGYDKFLVTSVSANFSEKIQITEVFGDNEVVYYFGKQPVIFNISGLLIDSPDNNWFVDWLKLYSEFMRGSQLAKNYELLKIVLPNMTITGTIMAFSYSQTSERDTDIPFNFQFMAKVIEPTPVTNEGMISSNKLKYVDFSQMAAFTNQKDINTLKGQVASLSGVLQDPTSSLYQKAAAMNALGTTTGGAFGEWMEGTKGTLEGFQSTIEGWTSGATNQVQGLLTSSLFQTVNSSLAGIRTNLFSPVYGILSSLTKLVSSVTNSVNNVVNALISPVRNILRDITNISNQAISLVNLVNSSITGIIRNTAGQLSGLANDFDVALHTLGKAAGAIATAPITVAQSVKGLLRGGAISSSPSFLTSPVKISFIRPSLAIPGGLVAPPKAQLLLGIPDYSSATSGVIL